MGIRELVDANISLCRYARIARNVEQPRAVFLPGVELIAMRGSIANEQAVGARELTIQLVQSSEVDWRSITDNAGGNPQFSPMALGNSALYACEDRQEKYPGSS